MSDESEFKEQATESGEFLLPILEGFTDRFIDSRVKNKFGDKLESERDSSDKYRQELKAKVEQTKKYLYNDRLQRRYNLKKSSKAPSFSDIDWDIKTK